MLVGLRAAAAGTCAGSRRSLASFPAQTFPRKVIAGALAEQRALERFIFHRAAPTGPGFPDFEAMVRGSGHGAAGAFDATHSCGNTMRCWASVFLSDEQINRNELFHIVAGGVWAQLVANPHVLLAERLPDTGLARAFCQKWSVHAADDLLRQLMASNDDGLLPRIFFCSMSWSTAPDRETKGHERCHHDHEFALIKHKEAGALSPRYQLVQGYHSTGNDAGFGLSQWQRSGNVHAALDGFGVGAAYECMLRLRAFGSNETWDDANHRAVFGSGATPMQGRTYWPAFSFKELRDEVVLAGSARSLSHHLSLRG